MLDPGQLRLSIALDSGQKEKWHRGNRRVSGPSEETSSILLASGARIGMGRGFEAEASLPVAWLDAKGEEGKESRFGAGDLLTRILWSRGIGGWTYGFSAGMYWPVGELGTSEVPATATFSTGTYDPAVDVFLSGPSFRGVDWYASAGTRQIFGEQDNGSRLGSSYTVSLGLTGRVVNRLAGQVLLSYFARERDEGNVMEDTGGDWLYIQPFLRADIFASASHAVQALVGVRVPLIQNVEGTQLVESTSLSLGFAHTLNF